MDVLRAGKPLVIGEVTLVPIEHHVVQSESGQMGCWLQGLNEPFAVIIVDTAGARAFDMEATELAVDALLDRVADLDRTLASVPH